MPTIHTDMRLTSESSAWAVHASAPTSRAEREENHMILANAIG